MCLLAERLACLRGLARARCLQVLYSKAVAQHLRHWDLLALQPLCTLMDKLDFARVHMRAAEAAMCSQFTRCGSLRLYGLSCGCVPAVSCLLLTVPWLCCHKQMTTASAHRYYQQDDYEMDPGLELADWSGKVGFKQLEALIVQWAAKKTCVGGCMERLSHEFLLKVADELQKRAVWSDGSDSD